MTIEVLSDATFDADVLGADVPVIVDFWAPWCQPCLQIADIMEELSGDYQGKVRFTKINVDDHPNAPSRFGVRGLPSLILFKNGAVESMKQGLVSKQELAAFIDSNI